MSETQYEWIKRSQRTAGAGEFPKRTIHLIQSFLSSKEAARTTLVSKSWRKAWLTRPNLDFDQSDHASIGDSIQNFSHFANKTLMRYSLSNKMIDTFSLRMKDRGCYRHQVRNPATSFVVKALKLGATRLSVEIDSRGYVLPDEVFRSETLVALSSKGCALNPDQAIRCSTLESLSLDSFWIQPDFITRILSSCPLIRSFSLSRISYVRYYGRGHDSSGYASYSEDDNYVYGYDDNDYHYHDGPRIRPHGLRSMVLKYVDYDILFLSDLSTRFPFLEDLTLHMSTERGRGDHILISSPTVERLTFVFQKRPPRMPSSQHRRAVRFDFPNIRKFTYEGSVVPRLSFISAPIGGWESNVSIKNVRKKRIVTSLFLKLRKFLRKLRRSTISSLDLRFKSKKSVDYEAGAIRCSSTPPEIEKLTVDFEGLPSLSCYALLDGLFRVCRPKLITQCGGKNNVDFLGQTLLQGMRRRISTRSQFMYGLNNLREARAEIFDEALSVWRDDVALDELLNDSITSPGDVNRNVRFQLNWHQSSTFRDNTATNVVQVQPRPVKVDFEDGDFVWVVLSRKRYSRAVSRRVGPFEIVEKEYSNDVYRLRIPSHVGAPDVIDVKHLVPYTGDDYLSSDEDEPCVNFLDTLEDNHVERLAWQFIEKQEHSKHFS